MTLKGVIRMNDGEKGVLLDFYSAGCAPCKRMDPVIRSFTEQNDAVEVRRIEANDAPEEFKSYNIGSVPTFVYLKDGREKGRISGVCGIKDIERLVSEG